MTAPARQIPADVVRRVALNTLGRMACVMGNPVDPGHRHAECVLDAEAYAADLILRLVFAATVGEDDLILDRLTDFTDALQRDRATQAQP